MLVDPISLSGMCSVIVPRLPPCRRCVPHSLAPSGPARRIRVSPRSIDYFAAVLFRVSLLDQGGSPAADRARWRPGAAAAPCLRHRCAGPRPLSAQVPPSQTARAGSGSPSPRTRLSPSRHDPAALMTLVSISGNVADAGTGLLETYVTGACSADSPSWLTFGGPGQNCAPNDRRSFALLPKATPADGGCSRTRIRARRLPRYHRYRGPDQGFHDRTTRNAVQAEGGPVSCCRPPA